MSELNAADLLSIDHPLNAHLQKWVAKKLGVKFSEAKDKLTKRQARKFLQAFPKYRGEYAPVVSEK